MSIYTCPHCGKKTFNPLKKAFAGQLNSKGKPCMECGKRCVNGKGATIFNAVYCVLCIIAIVVFYLLGDKKYETVYPWVYRYSFVINECLFLSILIVPKLVNSFFFKMAQAIRIEPTR
ncbi:MAG: hypothetical protein J6L05_01770 [Ruminococcus sp.]|nr:hypothetical protein [Ruminococcus sp.]